VSDHVSDHFHVLELDEVHVRKILPNWS